MKVTQYHPRLGYEPQGMDGVAHIPLSPGRWELQYFTTLTTLAFRALVRKRHSVLRL